jgi:hypothetical protein
VAKEDEFASLAALVDPHAASPAIPPIPGPTVFAAAQQRQLQQQRELRGKQSPPRSQAPDIYVRHLPD